MERPLDILSYLIKTYLKGYSEEVVFDKANDILRHMQYHEDKLDWNDIEALYSGLGELRGMPSIYHEPLYSILEHIESFKPAIEYRKSKQYKYYKKIIDDFMKKNEIKFKPIFYFYDVCGYLEPHREPPNPHDLRKVYPVTLSSLEKMVEDMKEHRWPDKWPKRHITAWETMIEYLKKEKIKKVKGKGTGGY